MVAKNILFSFEILMYMILSKGQRYRYKRYIEEQKRIAFELSSLQVGATILYVDPSTVP